MANNIQTTLISGLSEQTTADDTDYMVIGGTDAKKISWKNIWTLIRAKLGIGNASELGTTSKEIVGAINELNTNMTDIVAKVNVALPSITVGANTGVVSNDVKVSNYVPSGYKALAVVPAATGSNGLYFYSTNIAASGMFYVQLRNITSAAITVTPVVTLLCIRSL